MMEGGHLVNALFRVPASQLRVPGGGGTLWSCGVAIVRVITVRVSVRASFLAVLVVRSAHLSTELLRL